MRILDKIAFRDQRLGDAVSRRSADAHGKRDFRNARRFFRDGYLIEQCKSLQQALDHSSIIFLMLGVLRSGVHFSTFLSTMWTLCPQLIRKRGVVNRDRQGLRGAVAVTPT